LTTNQFSKQLVVRTLVLGKMRTKVLTTNQFSKRLVVRTLVLGKMRTKVLTTNQFSLLILQIDVEVAVGLVAYRLNFLGKRL
ncbi:MULTISPECIES: hypothetical protein, partial [unclassified Microcoleus]|uniref:hypothetical protein n=1 Tax=unclassified Microcoleus TaxID=2642155 RepID=UPI0025D94A08